MIRLRTNVMIVCPERDYSVNIRRRPVMTKTSKADGMKVSTSE